MTWEGPDRRAATVVVDEEALAASAIRGDADAIGLLWERHRRWIAAVILAHKPAFEDLDDLLQEVAVTFIAKAETVREVGNLRAWLRVVAINAARAAGRSGRCRTHASLGDDDQLIGAMSGEFLDADEDERLRQLLRRLERLSPTYREPLLLRALRGLSSRQIAELLDIPPATVDTRIARARRMLRDAEGHETASPGSTNGVARHHHDEPTISSRLTTQG